ncbi:Spy/CpxP family protein refolding chaperone [Variovorax sp. J22R24]|uniref:Spy/CpxP family protein refolding chaperone n=1 Tax=Variovorax gracilis TaxID=3053502 RepID=UPI00257762EC|nr:Spy/CpxP family protein refolding chaperone [Variovorax sp. J22R24]MDM0107484.1 Spy/CpxP family protein refolding chaperone [Variovorax sp. J22R24]
MITSRKSLLWASLLASATFASAGAFAQQAPQVAPAAPATTQAQPGAQPQAKHQHTREDRAQRFERMKQHRAERLSALKEKLKLTPAQEGAWNSFATAQQPPARSPEQARAERAEFAKLTTPQRLDRMQARQAERSAMFAKRADATRSFYAGLTPEQQKTFDAESMARFGRGEHGGQHRHPAPPAKS